MTLEGWLDLIFNIVGAIFVALTMMQNLLVIKQNNWLKRQSDILVDENNQLRDNHNQNAREFNALLAQNKLLKEAITGKRDEGNDTR